MDPLRPGQLRRPPPGASCLIALAANPSRRPPPGGVGRGGPSELLGLGSVRAGSVGDGSTLTGTQFLISTTTTSGTSDSADAYGSRERSLSAGRPPQGAPRGRIWAARRTSGRCERARGRRMGSVDGWPLARPIHLAPGGTAAARSLWGSIPWRGPRRGPGPPSGTRKPRRPAPAPACRGGPGPGEHRGERWKAGAMSLAQCRGRGVRGASGPEIGS